jgi:hypothetical protein
VGTYFEIVLLQDHHLSSGVGVSITGNTVCGALGTWRLEMERGSFFFKDMSDRETGSSGSCKGEM